MDDAARSDRQFAFEQAAELYDAARPGYPDELIDHLCEAAALQAGARVLDVGAGTGRATEPLLARGLSVTALEPGAAMHAILERKLGDQVDLVQRCFEDYEPERPFAAVVSAQAFHWVHPDVRLSHARRALTPGGFLAPIRNNHDPTCPFRVASQPLYARLFGPPEPTPARHTTAGIVDLVSTFSETIRMRPALRQRLLDGLAEVVDRLGGQTPYHRTAQLVIGRRR